MRQKKKVTETIGDYCSIILPSSIFKTLCLYTTSSFFSLWQQLVKLRLVKLRKRGQLLIAYSLKLGWIHKWNTKWNKIRDVLKMCVTDSSNGAYNMNYSDALWGFGELRKWLDLEVLCFRILI